MGEGIGLTYREQELYEGKDMALRNVEITDKKTK